VCEDLEGEQLLRRGGEDPEAREVEDGRRGGILALEKALDGIVEPTAGKFEALADNGGSLIDSALGLENRIDTRVERRSSKASAMAAPPTTYISALMSRLSS
jgi:hypothetical protein